MDIGHVLTALQAKLNLNTMQQGMWATATAQSTSTRDAMRANMNKLHDAMAAELAKTAPDLNAVAAAADDLQAANQTLRRGARDQWLKLYATFTPEQVAAGQAYFNYGQVNRWGPEIVGISVFFKDDAGDVYHTYSCYSRGVDMLNGAYHYLDLTPKGRDEAGQGPNPQAWVRRHDEYTD